MCVSMIAYKPLVGVSPLMALMLLGTKMNSLDFEVKGQGRSETECNFPLKAISILIESSLLRTVYCMIINCNLQTSTCRSTRILH